MDGDTILNRDGEFILYWMHHSLRGHENPALDVALLAAKQLRLPIFVYQGLSERSAYASDRHHMFILQGARDAHAELARRGIGSALHVERRGHRGPHLKALADRAAVVVTEDFPTVAMNQSIQRLAARISAPIWLVDTACVVPMRMVGRAYDRAFAYRDATRRLLDERLTRSWPEQPDPGEAFVPSDLSFPPIDLSTTDFSSLLSLCDIDHSVGPVPHTVGGSRAGYARWDAFKSHKLRRYAADRNDALRDGVSRMSAYLHYGMVSPPRIAREAAEVGGAGAEKYLDELIIWRELAYTFCFYLANPESLDAIPKWALETLRAHESDPRPALLDWETLARGRTGDPLWDAAQRSLLIQGELHNNVRMTWGKAFLGWTANASEALRLMVDLNHRYALDGRDPASSGGLLWCLGQFDRPHTPPHAINGTVRTRPTQEHSSRLDPEKYLAKVTRPWQTPMPRVAVIGAGVSGLIAARALHDHGFTLTVFEKSRGCGGRTATRRVDSRIHFDHGAQYFTARDPHFARHVEAWIKQGVVAEWTGRIVEIERDEVRPKTDQPQRYVGTPGMTAVARHLADDLRVRYETRIARMDHTSGGWQLLEASGERHGPFDHVIVALPSPQAAELLGDHAFAAEARAVPMAPCWAVLAAFERRIETEWDGAFVHESPISWAARNSSKPGRDPLIDCWVIHASPHWSAAHLDRAADDVTAALLEEFAKILAAPTPPTLSLDAHRWLFSATPLSLDRLSLFDPGAGLAVCGDWMAGGRVEGAFRSGVAAAGSILRQVGVLAKETAQPRLSRLEG